MRGSTPVVEGITLDELERDPYPLYRRLRAEAPVAFLPLLDSWIVTRWDDCDRIGKGGTDWQATSPLGDAPRARAAGARPPLRTGGRADPPHIAALDRSMGSPNILYADGPLHSDLRAAVMPHLEPKAVLRSVDDMVAPIARDYAASLETRGAADLTAAYFEPVSVEALRRLLGLDGIVDSATLVRWFHSLSDGSSNFALDEDVFADSDRTNAEIDDVLGPVLDELRRRPDGSMLSHMVHVGRHDDAPRTNAEVLPTLKVAITGGMQEPGHAAASALLGLLQHPDQLAAVLADPSLIPAAVHEGLRWIAPIGMTARYAVGDQAFGDVTIPHGAHVEISLASANRDERRYSDPDRFDITRSRQPNQSFGHGAHFCAGHFFARQVERIMLEELFAAAPGIRLDPDRPAEVLGLAFRAPKTLPALWDAAPRTAPAEEGRRAERRPDGAGSMGG